jgi:hypothetical protein
VPIHTPLIVFKCCKKVKFNWAATIGADLPLNALEMPSAKSVGSPGNTIVFDIPTAPPGGGGSGANKTPVQYVIIAEAAGNHIEESGSEESNLKAKFIEVSNPPEIIVLGFKFKGIEPNAGIFGEAVLAAIEYAFANSVVNVVMLGWLEDNVEVIIPINDKLFQAINLFYFYYLTQVQFL